MRRHAGHLPELPQITGALRVKQSPIRQSSRIRGKNKRLTEKYTGNPTISHATWIIVILALADQALLAHALAHNNNANNNNEWLRKKI